MERNLRLFAEKVAPSEGDVRFALVDVEGNVIYSNLARDLEGRLTQLAKMLIDIMDVGDYQVKRMDETKILFSKVGEGLVAVLEGKREGLMILEAQRIAREFREAVEAGVVVEPAPKPTQPPPTPSVVTPPKLEKVVFEDSIPRLTGEHVELKLDAETLRLLRLVDGKTSIRTIAEIAGVDLITACRKFEFLVDNNVVSVEMPEEIDPRFLEVYEPDPSYESIDALLADLPGRSIATRTLAANLDKGYTVLELAVAMRRAGFDVTTEEVYNTLKALEITGRVRRKE